MGNAGDMDDVGRVLSALAAAARSVRLYPPANPITRQVAIRAADALTHGIGGAPLTLAIAREGFAIDGESVVTASPGVVELADALRERGTATITLQPGVTDDDVLGLAATVAQPTVAIAASGGIGAVLRAHHVSRISLSEVHLSTIVVPEARESVDLDLDRWLQDLGSDVEKLSAWYEAASAGDPAVFEEGLIEIARAAGVLGAGLFDTTLAAAFNRQTADARDVLLTRTCDSEELSSLVGRMFSELPAEHIATSLTGGVLGRNMLSLSHALTSLPIGSKAGDVHDAVRRRATAAGHTPKEVAFLDHMVKTRLRQDAKSALAESDGAYRAVRDAADLPDDEVARARDAVIASDAQLSRAGIRTMLALLDQQHDFELYCETVGSLIAMVPGLAESGELGLVRRVLQELSNRQSAHTAPWPGLAECLESALACAADVRVMRAVLAAVISDHSYVPDAREIVALLGEPAAVSLTTEAITLKGEGIEVAERLLGSARAVQLLAGQAPNVEWHNLEALVSRLARERDPVCMAAVEGLLACEDVRSRREVARGLAAAAAPAPSRLLARALRDSDPEVVRIVATGVARCGVPGSADLLCRRLDELSIDGADYALGRDIIGALAVTPEGAAQEALERLARRKSLIKRGHFADVQIAVEDALRERAANGGAQL